MPLTLSEKRKTKDRSLHWFLPLLPDSCSRCLYTSHLEKSCFWSCLAKAGDTLYETANSENTCPSHKCMLNPRGPCHFHLRHRFKIKTEVPHAVQRHPKSYLLGKADAFLPFRVTGSPRLLPPEELKTTLCTGLYLWPPVPQIASLASNISARPDLGFLL